MEKESKMIERGKSNTSLSPVLVDMETIFQRLNEITSEISNRAFGLFEERGLALGSQVEDWLKAEADILRQVPVKITETEDKIQVSMAMAGFSPQEIEVGIKGSQLYVTGRSGTELKSSDENTFYSEWKGNRFYRELPLPCPVDEGSLTTELKEGILTLAMAKAEAAGREQVSARSA